MVTKRLDDDSAGMTTALDLQNVKPERGSVRVRQQKGAATSREPYHLSSLNSEKIPGGAEISAQDGGPHIAHL